MMYLASPYSANPKENYRGIAVAASDLFVAGHLVFSPILHWHQASKWCQLPTDAGFWWDYNRQMLEKSTALCVVKLCGWDTSVGVKMELQHWAETLGRPEVDTYQWHNFTFGRFEQ